MDFDIIIIGSGPGGYVAAIRASQLGKKVAVVERAEVGGICLNWGCIPTKALLKSAQVYNYIKHSNNYGINIEGEIIADFNAMVNRSRGVAANMSKGVQFLFKKHGIELIQGEASFIKTNDNKVIENLLKLLAENKRLNIIPDIADELKKEIAILNNSYEGIVYTNIKLKSNDLSDIQNKFAKKFDIKLSLTQNICNYDGIKVDIEGLGVEIGFSKDRFKSQMIEHILKAV